MRLLVAIVLFFSTILLIHAQLSDECPDFEEFGLHSESFLRKTYQSTCRVGIKLDGAKGIEFIKIITNIAFMPKALEKDVDLMIKKCHKETFDYCTEGDQKSAMDCIKGLSGGVMLKHGKLACAEFNKALENNLAGIKAAGAKLLSALPGKV